MDKFQCVPVYLEEAMQSEYEDFCHNVLKPIFHFVHPTSADICRVSFHWLHAASAGVCRVSLEGGGKGRSAEGGVGEGEGGGRSERGGNEREEGEGGVRERREREGARSEGRCDFRC
eukprot:2848389-Rhodomonas_salina.2